MSTFSGEDQLAEHWADAAGVDERRVLENRLREFLVGDLTKFVCRELQRLGVQEGVLSVDDAVDVTLEQLGTVLATYVESAPQNGRKCLQSYVMGSARKVILDLLNGHNRDEKRLARVAAAHPSRFGHPPTTPSRKAARREIEELLAQLLARFDETDQEILRRRAAKESFPRIGRELGMPAETIRDRFYRCAAELRRAVERELGGDPWCE